MNTSRRTLYPELPAYRTGMLDVSGGHRIAFEESGNPEGQPVVFVHGGPGGGTSPDHRRFFDPAVYRIVLFDQRGCGKSTPFASLSDNTTWDLVADMEALRVHLGINKWHVFGGSWGSTLALAYAQTHPQSVRSLVIRGIFLVRKQEIDWFYQKGCDAIFPDAWEDYVKPIAESERGDMVRAYYKRLTSIDAKVRAEAAKAWSIWEGRTSHLYVSDAEVARMGADDFADAFARIECHYFVNNGFFNDKTALLANVDKIRHIPCVIVQGRYDVVCPMTSAWDLHKAWPEAELRVTPDAGHSAFEPGNVHELILATDKMGRAS